MVSHFSEPTTLALGDINADGHPDIYVCNDFQTPDRFWLNDGKGRFRELGPTAIRSVSYASMGVDFADLDRDGHTDFFVAEMLSRTPMNRLLKISPNTPAPPQPGASLGRLQVPSPMKAIHHRGA